MPTGSARPSVRPNMAQLITNCHYPELMIPHFDLKRQTRQLKDELMQALEHTLDNCQFILGDEVLKLEETFSAYCQAEAAAGVSSGTSALHLALLACDVGSGDEVITVPFTFAATVAAILYTGATPRFVDIEPGTFTMDASKLEAAISEKTRAIMPVHLYGQAADMDAINAIASKHNLSVIEDAAQAHGAEYRGKRVGALGDIAGFSFYPGKNIGACGEGGICVSQDAKLIERVKTLRNWGQQGRYQHVLKGFNYRMDGFQGAVLNVKMRHIEAWTERRIAIAERYRDAIAHPALTLPALAETSTRHVYHQFVLLCEEREDFRAAMQQAGIGTNVHYPHPLYRMEAYSDLGYQAGDFPTAESVAVRCVSLPLFPEMTDEEVNTVIQAVNEWQ